MQQFLVVQFGANSAQKSVTDSATSTNIPKMINGTFPGFIRITNEGPNTVRFKPQAANVNPTLNAMPSLPVDQSVIVNVSGYDEIRLQCLSGGTASVVIDPLENQ